MPELTALYLAHRQQLQALRPGRLGAAHRELGRREPDVRHPRHPRGPKSTRLEYRQTAADINPYIAMATCSPRASGASSKSIEPPPPVDGDASRARASFAPLPRTLARGERPPLAQSEAPAAILGEAFVDHYVRTRDWECRQYERAVTEWELKRYFEAI